MGFGIFLEEFRTAETSLKNFHENVLLISEKLTGRGFKLSQNYNLIKTTNISYINWKQLIQRD